MAGTDNNGPTFGNGNRMRNAFSNILSKNQINYNNRGGKSALPSLDPASTANYYSQLAGLYAGYQNQLLALKQQRVGAKADFQATAAGVRAEKITGLADTENAAIERGVGGSSADLQARSDVRGAAEAAIQQAKREKMETIAGTRIAAQQAGIDYFMGAQTLEAQKLAQQQALLAQQLEQNLIVSGQESQMDVLQAIYQSLMRRQQAPNGGGGNGGGGRGNSPLGSSVAGPHGLLGSSVAGPVKNNVNNILGGALGQAGNIFGGLFGRNNRSGGGTTRRYL